MVAPSDLGPVRSQTRRVAELLPAAFNPRTSSPAALFEANDDEDALRVADLLRNAIARSEGMP